MKRFVLPVLVLLVVLLFLQFAPQPVFSARIQLAPPEQPEHGWVVCAILDVAPVPGVPDARQRFELCHADGYRYQVYCLDPGQPVPEIGTICSEISEGRFWCGTNLQELQLYGVLETPAADTATPAPSATATATMTATSTATQLAMTRTPAPSQEETPTSTPTLPNRPRAGGPGNMAVLSAALFLIILFSGWTILVYSVRRVASRMGKETRA